MPDPVLILKILEFLDHDSANAGTSSSNIVYASHGLSAGDMIVNTTRRSNITAERGSRLVHYIGVDEDNIPLAIDIADQAEGDDIRLYKYTDRTNKLKVQTLDVVNAAGNGSEAKFTLITTKDYIPVPGQYVKIEYPSAGDVIFWGVISDTNTTRMFENGSNIEVDCGCVGLHQILTRRTIRVNFIENGTLTMGDIVNSVVTDYLHQDGIRAGTINAGTILQDDWVDDAVSISEILDECASRSGYQWFVDNAGLVHFFSDPDPIVDNAVDITDGGAFTDYKNVSVSKSLDGYNNKIFLTGGNDDSGDQITISNYDGTEINRMQNVCGGTGVHGDVVRDAGMNSSNRVIAGANTTTTSIHSIGHGQEAGWIVINLTRSTASAIAYTRVLTITDDDNFTCDLVTGQTADDVILLFDDENTVLSSFLRSQRVLPNVLNFDTGTPTSFVVASKMSVTLDVFGITNKSFMVEEMRYYDFNGKNVRCKIKAIERDGSDFNTRKSKNFLDYFGGF